MEKRKNEAKDDAAKGAGNYKILAGTFGVLLFSREVIAP